MTTLSLKKIGKKYGNIRVMNDISLEVKSGEFIVFIGPSGCGKSTLLRMIAGIEEISDGELLIDGKKVNDTPASKREVAMVFQSYALYPHMNVYKNMAFSLMIAKIDKKSIDKKVQEVAEILQISQYLNRLPKDLSGGQRQRVAIGRALVRNPKIFLFDEPLSNLDAALRGQTRLEIARLHQRLDATMIYVTHDQVEAMTLADRILVLNQGEIEQIGSPLELYDKPKNLFVAGFIGSPKMNLLSQKEFNNLSFIDDGIKNQVKTIGIRPENLVSDNSENAILQGIAEVKENLGEFVLAHFQNKQVKENTFIVKLPHNENVEIGKQYGFNIGSQNIHLFNLSDERIN